MKQGILQKVLSAVLTLAFFALVRPDPDPSIVGVAFTALLMYECLYESIRYASRMHRRKRRERFKEELECDISRWAEEWFNPFTEVS